MEYQRDYKHISDVLDRRIYIDKVPISPDPAHILDAFRLCPYNKVKLVILAQEPYKEGATGIAFSSTRGITPSLEVLASWLEISNISTDLMSWCEQGVLMLNASMSIETHNNAVNHKVLWEAFIRGCLATCSTLPHICYLLLGAVAESYSTSIKSGLVIREKHPAYYARNKIYESKLDIFTKINNHLISHNKTPIDFWSIDGSIL